MSSQPRKTIEELQAAHRAALPAAYLAPEQEWEPVNVPLEEHPLAELSRQWQVFGCAVCGETASVNSDSGWRIELHHLVGRGRPGSTDDPSNLMGLCGELRPKKCHWRVTTNRLKIEWSDVLGRHTWVDTRTGQTGVCRVLSLDTLRSAGFERALEAPVDAAKARVTRRRPVPAERLLAAVGEGYDETGQAGAEKRFMLARELNEKAERAWMRLAVVVQKGMELNDPYHLGFDSVQEWADAIGVGAATMSKLRTIGSSFAGAWETLPEGDRKMLSLEGLYVAALMRRDGEWDERTALAEAVAKPVAQLWRDYREAKEVAESGVVAHRCQCPTCGHWHTDQREGPPVE